MLSDELLSIMKFGCEETMDLQENKCTYIESVINKEKMLIQKDYEGCCVVQIIWMSLDFYYCLGNIIVLRKSKCLEKFKPEVSAVLCIFKK